MPSTPPLTLPSRLSTPDLAIVVLYLIAITLFGLSFRKRGGKDKSLKSYFLADNTIPWWAIALSIVSAETSTLTIISIPGVAFAGDLGFLQVVLGYMLGRIVVALLFLPRYFRGEMLTAYQLINQRFSSDRPFGHTLYKLTAGLFLLTRAAAEGVRVFAISIVVGIAIGTGDILSIALISALTLLYTFEGGMAAVIWTDVVQMALYVAGTLVALWTLSHHVPGGWTHIHAVAAPLGKFHWLNFSLNLTQSYTFWAGVLGGTFLTMASHGTDQLMVQRMLAARNLRQSRLALLSSGLVIFLQFTLFLLIGVGLFVFYGPANPLGAPSIARSAMGGISTLSPDRIFPTFIVHQMPHGVAGLLVAAILAAAMSNLSAALNSLASTTVIDFWLPFRTPKPSVILSEGAPAPQSKDPEASHPATSARAFQPSAPPPLHPPDTALISRLATVFWALVLFAIAVYSIHAGGKGHVVETGLSIASVAYGCLLGVFLLGTLTRYATQTGAILGMISGLALNLYLWKFTPVAFTWYVLIGSLATFAIGSFFSLILPKPRRRTATAIALLLCFSSLSFRSEAQKPASVVALAYRYPKASALGLSNGVERIGLQPLGYALLSQPHAPDFTPASALINQAIAAHKLPGAVLLVGHNGHIVFEQAYGLRKLANEPGLDGKPSPAEPMTLDTIFDMASLTKVLVTTTAILQLYEQGKLDLDTPVAHYLPAFATAAPQPDVIPSGAQSAQSRDPDASRTPTTAEPFPPPAQSPALAWKSQITIRQLLTHYSGLPEDVSLKDPWGLAAPDKAEGIRRAMASVPYGPPGLTFKYSDINFISLGYLVETLSGQPLDDYAQHHIFTPLAMTETRYLPLAKACGPIDISGSALSLPPASGPRAPSIAPLAMGGNADRSLAGLPCPAEAWHASELIPRIAPTAHDDESESNPSLNPDFDHLLRGTVHDPTTRRMGGVAGHAGVFSTAQDTAKFCQALLDKLLHNTGPFPLQQSTLQLATSPQAPATALPNATIFSQDQQPTKGVAQRGLGWDINSPFSRPRGEIFPIATGGYGKPGHPGSFGHTGFTGTSIWIDPVSDTYVILLANAIHPRGGAPISPLRSAVATAVAHAIMCSEPNTFCDLTKLPRTATNPGAPFIAPSAMSGPSGGTQPPSPETVPTLTGIDVLEQTSFAALNSLAATLNHPLRLGLLTNQSGLDRHGARTIDILLHAGPSIALTTLFSPEHGLYGKQDTENLKSEADPVSHLPVISLYGLKSSDKHPRQSDLKALDAILIDLQDIGARFWTYETLLGYMLESCAHAHIPVFVLDRPNPIDGLARDIQGPAPDLGVESYFDFMPLPVRHSLTIGELARYFNAFATEVQLDPRLLDAGSVEIGTPGQGVEPPATQPGLHAQLTVIAMQNWSRSQYFTSTGLPWTPPSPNMRTPATAIVYPGVAQLEYNPISVGRGFPAPYENIGAPWLKAPELAAYLTARHIPGITITPTSLTIAETAEHYPFHGQTIPGIHFQVTDPAAFDSPEFGIELLSALNHLYPAELHLERARTLLLNAATLEALKQGRDPRDIAASWQPAIQAFAERRKSILLYP